MRITASWSGSLAHRIQACGRSLSTTRGLPSNVVIPTNSKCAVVLGAVKDEPRGGATRHP